MNRFTVEVMRNELLVILYRVYILGLGLNRHGDNVMAKAKKKAKKKASKKK